MKKYCLLVISFVILSQIMCSCDTSSHKGSEYSDLCIDLITYQIPGDKPHQYIRFGQGGAHYPECKYCKQSNDSIE